MRSFRFGGDAEEGGEDAAAEDAAVARAIAALDDVLGDTAPAAARAADPADRLRTALLIGDAEAARSAVRAVHGGGWLGFPSQLLAAAPHAADAGTPDPLATALGLDAALRAAAAGEPRRERLLARALDGAGPATPLPVPRTRQRPPCGRRWTRDRAARCSRASTAGTRTRGSPTSRPPKR